LKAVVEIDVGRAPLLLVEVAYWRDGCCEMLMLRWKKLFCFLLMRRTWRKVVKVNDFVDGEIRLPL